MIAHHALPVVSARSQARRRRLASAMLDTFATRELQFPDLLMAQQEKFVQPEDTARPAPPPSKSVTEVSTTLTLERRPSSIAPSASEECTARAKLQSPRRQLAMKATTV